MFPFFCIGCEKEGVLLCEPCLKAIPFAKARCPVCRAPSAFGRTCAAHRSSLDGCIAVASYAHPWVRDMIRLWKFEYVREIETVLVRLLLRHLQDAALPSVAWSLIPVPLHPKRLNERGFSQTRVLSDILSEITGDTVETQLLSHGWRLRRRQADIASEAKRRTQKLHAYFRVKGDGIPTHVLLVDDVYTTGATMEGAARVLKQAGVKYVWGFVLARNK